MVLRPAEMEDLDRSEVGKRLARRTGVMRFSGWHSLGTRILIVNLLALAALAGALFYLESFRARLIETREQELVRQGEMIADMVSTLEPTAGMKAVHEISTSRGTRARLIGRNGQVLADNWANPEANRFVLVDPAREGFQRESAVLIDRMIDAIIGKQGLDLLPEDEVGKLPDYPEIVAAALTGKPDSRARQTAERLIVLQTAVPVVHGQTPYRVMLLTVDASDVIELVRQERQASFLVFLGVLAASLGLSVYLARTIVVPLRQLAVAAHRVRRGQAREVLMPRMPHRRDEIGGLARALADMTTALRQRIDATEAFAADVAHELKNPLASIRSAVEALDRVRDEDARAQLFQLIQQDVGRIDRLILDISAASRLDAELSRTWLKPVRIDALVKQLVQMMQSPGPLPGDVNLQALVNEKDPIMVAADADRLAQVLNNLIDNAISFSPNGGEVIIGVERQGLMAIIYVEDEGPGVPTEAQESIFERFYTERPGHEDYGRHSGLGLSIASAIVEAMEGNLRVEDRPDGQTGARFVVTIPAL